MRGLSDLMESLRIVDCPDYGKNLRMTVSREDVSKAATELASLRERVKDEHDDALRLHREKCDAIDRAIAAESRAARLQQERDEAVERCAKVVESFAPATQDMMSTTISDYCDSIAAAIRQLAAGKNEE